jgi:hypothetical protein
MKSGLWRSGLSIWALVIALINTSLHVKKMFHIVLSRTFKFEKKNHFNCTWTSIEHNYSTINPSYLTN